MSDQSREWTLEPETEYRFELDPKASVAIKLLRGHAEVFGAELLDGKSYIFGHECKAAIFTWQGCTIQVTGKPSTEYVSDETPMSAYGNVHVALEQMRVRALAAMHGSPLSDEEGPVATTEPPRVLVLGPESSGKTSLCKILANYAMRSNQGWSPIFANVDTSEGGWVVPGTASAVPITSPLPTASPVNGLGMSATSAPMHIASNALLPLVYWYGHAPITRNPLLLDRIIRNLGENIGDRWDADPEARASGIIVDTPSAFSTSKPGAAHDHRMDLLKACVDAFSINLILVVGHEKLNVEMQRAFGSRMPVIKVPKSGGVVELDSSYRERIRSLQVHAYMYGLRVVPPPGASDVTQGGDAPDDYTLAPSSSAISFEELHIYRIGEETMAPSSALPIGAARVVSELQPLPIDPRQPGSGLLNAVLALLAPPNPDENERYDEEILDLHVVGFVVITALDMANRKMTVLTPSAGSLTGKTVVAGSIEWTEPE